MSLEKIELKEFKIKNLPAEKLSVEIGKFLQRQYRNKISIEFPSLGTDNQWKLLSKGWVGFIPLTPLITLRLSPKIEITNLFQMLQYAYDFEIQFQDELINCATIEGFYEKLAHLLALRVLNRAQKGFYRTYISTTERLSCIRGRLDIKHAIYNPWEVKLKCNYQELTGDVPENQILIWTLFILSHSGVCNRTLPIIRQAYQALQGLATVQPYNSEDCVNRHYSRLNEDYRPLHALCRFFLESTGASHHEGDYAMLAFLVNMAKLFESFVASWLTQNLPHDYRLEKQERLIIDSTQGLFLQVDIVIYETKSSAVRYVLDTKYKSKYKSEDFSQIVSYAFGKKCCEAVLVYPEAPDRCLDQWVNDIHVRTLIFSLDGNLEEAGKRFLDTLLYN